MKNKILIFFLCMVFLCMPVMIFADDVDAVKKTVFSWRDAWQNKNLKKYRSFYSMDFQSGTRDYHGWMKRKAAAFKRSGSILIKISEPDIRFNERKAVVTFNQKYQSSHITDYGKKTLDMKKIGSKWKIVSEKWDKQIISIPIDNDKAYSQDKISIKRIDYFIDQNSGEKVFVCANRFFHPRVIALEGKKPRIAIDISNVSSSREHRAIPVNGIFIKRIRTHFHRSSKTLRIVLDLNPEKEYDVKQAYFKGKHIYGIEISDATFQKHPELDTGVFDLII